MRPSWLGSSEEEALERSIGSGGAGVPDAVLVQPSRWGRHTEHNLVVQPDGLTLAYELPHTSPSSSTSSFPFGPQRPLVAVAQADRGFSALQGLCYFEVTLADIGASGDVYVGLTHADHPLNAHIGSTERSYGLYLRERLRFKGGKQLRWKSHEDEPTLKSGDIVGCGINNTTHEVFFTYNGRALPGQLQGIHGELYPTVSLCSTGAQIIAQFRPPFYYAISLNWAPPDVVDYLPRELNPWACGSSITLSEANTVVEYTGSHDGVNGLVLADHPFNPARKLSYFEIEILNHGKKGWIAVGLCVSDYPLTHHPGWRYGSWGYHGDDGRKFGASGTGEPFGPTYTTGDVIGIGLNHSRRELFCTKNGFFLGVAFSNIDEEILFPCVGLHSTGEKVRVRFQPPFIFQSEAIDRAFTTTPKLKRSLSTPKTCSLPQNFKLWTPEQVGQWLDSSVNLGQYRKLFIDNDITGEMLESLGDSDVLKKELGITSFGHRMQIVKHISNLLDQRKSDDVEKSKSTTSDPEEREREEIMGERRPQSSMGARRLSLHDDRAPTAIHVRYEDLEMGECIGKGFFGEVRRARWRGTDVAVKVIYRRSFRSQDEFQLFEKEVSVLSMLRHPCIVQFMGVCLGTKNCIVTEFMAEGNLENFVLRNLPMIERNPYLRTRIIANIAKGMCYLHGWTPEPILHRDLTPRNILLDKHFNAKVADFGLSRAKGENRMTEGVGFLPFQAPEVFKGEEYSEKADVYSFGMLVWFLFAGKQPDEGFPSALRMANMVAHNGYRPALPDAMQEHWRVVVRACWHPHPSSRPSFSEVLRTIEHYKQLQSGESGYLFGELMRPVSLRVSPQKGGSSEAEDQRPTHSYPQHSASMPSLANVYYYEQNNNTQHEAEDSSSGGSQSAPPQRRSKVNSHPTVYLSSDDVTAAIRAVDLSDELGTLPTELEEQCSIASLLRNAHRYSDGNRLRESSQSENESVDDAERENPNAHSHHGSTDEQAGEENDVIAARLFRPS